MAAIATENEYLRREVLSKTQQVKQYKKQVDQYKEKVEVLKRQIEMQIQQVIIDSSSVAKSYLLIGCAMWPSLKPEIQCKFEFVLQHHLYWIPKSLCSYVYHTEQMYTATVAYKDTVPDSALN